MTKVTTLYTATVKNKCLQNVQCTISNYLLQLNIKSIKTTKTQLDGENGFIKL